MEYELAASLRREVAVENLIFGAGSNGHGFVLPAAAGGGGESSRRDAL
jgi:hypothetical protein